MFSDNFVKLCAERGVHPTLVSEKLGYSRTMGAKWAKGATPRTTTLRKIADYFDVSVEELTEEVAKKAPTTEGERNNDKVAMLVSLFERLPPEEQNDVIFQLLNRAQAQLDRDAQK